MKMLLPLVAVLLVLSVPVAAALTITSATGSTVPTINANGFSGVGELSGITYVGPTGTAGVYKFYAVSDNATGEGAIPRIYGIEVTFNMGTGAIISAKVTSQINLSVGFDTEGLAYNSQRNSVYVADEYIKDAQGEHSIIREHSLPAGNIINTLPVPAVFSSQVYNYGFESLTRQRGGESIWTANEEGLTADGGISTTSKGSTIRLLKYDGNHSAVAQYAYQTDTAGSGSYGRCGVSDLCVLPDGTLLVLERYLSLNFRTRIYLVDFTGATDVSGIEALVGASYTKTSKTRLYEKSWGFADQASNYEGICLGPQLDDGSWSMLMVADYGVGSAQRIYALKIRGVRVSIKGTVNLGDFDQSKVDGTAVTVDITGVDRMTPTRTVTTTLDNNGTFEVTGVDPGKYDIGIKPSHWLRKSIGPVIVSDRDVVLDIR